MKSKLLKTLTLMLCLSVAFFIASCGGEKGGCKKPSKESVQEVSQGLEYKLNSDGKSYSVVSIGSCSDTDIVMPSTYSDLPITGIEEWAFAYCDSLTSVVIGDSVESIGDNAFYYCDSLTSVVIGDSVESIGYSAFSDCKKLTSVVIPNSVKFIGRRAFTGCRSLTSVTFKDTSTWHVTENSDYTGGSSIGVTDATQNATYLTSTYFWYYWYKG